MKKFILIFLLSLLNYPSLSSQDFNNEKVKQEYISNCRQTARMWELNNYKKGALHFYKMAAKVGDGYSINQLLLDEYHGKKIEDLDLDNPSKKIDELWTLGINADLYFPLLANITIISGQYAQSSQDENLILISKTSASKMIQFFEDPEIKRNTFKDISLKELIIPNVQRGKWVFPNSLDEVEAQLRHIINSTVQ